MSYKGTDAEFIRATFYLDSNQQRKLPNGPEVEVLTIECRRDQRKKLKDGSVAYNLGKRSWYRGPVWWYDVAEVTHRDHCILVKFVVRDAKTQLLHDECMVKWILDADLPAPMIDDYQVRETTIERFCKIDKKIRSEDAEKFFTSVSMALLQACYRQNPEILSMRKPVNKELLRLRMKWLGEFPSNFPQYRHLYGNESPTVIADQRLDDPKTSPDAIGNIVVILTDKNGNTETFRW